MKRSQRSQRKQSRSNRLEFHPLESRIMLANDLLPDVFAWEDVDRGYLHDYVIEGDLLRFSTAFANQGAGHLEVYGGEVLDNGNQEVIQRIYNDEGGYRDRVAGEFTYHSGHGHIHFDGYAIYNLREIGPSGEVGDIIATGGKISFCLIDITRYDDGAGSSNYGSCGTTQGVSAGWSDVYSRGLADQWINISGIADGDYYLEVVTDPEDQLVESDETNNTTIITITIEDGPGAQGDRFESNNTFETAYNLGMFSDRVEAGLSIHSDQDQDFFQFNAVEHGEFEVHVNFSHDLGNIDAFVYDNEFNLIASGDSVDDLEDLHFHTHPDQAYYLQIVGVDGATNAYDLEFFGPGEVITDTVSSDDVPVSIPDGASSSSPGETITSTLEGPDLTLTDINLILDELRHTYLADLHIDLTSPSGTTVTVLRSAFESPSGPLGGENDFVNTIMDDQAPTNIDDGTAPYSGSFNVNYADVDNPFSVFNGENALGTWTISITDWYAADTGTLNAWSLMFTGIDNNPGDVFEQNDAFPQATDLGTIGIASHADLSIHNQSDVDFFRFNAQDSTHVQIDLEFLHDQGNLDFVIYDSNQQEIGVSDSINDNESLTLPVVEGELYYIEVFGESNATNSYNFSIDVPLMVAESGSIGNINNFWKQITLTHHFDDPVVIVSAPGYNSDVATAVETRNVTSNSFEVRLHNWELQVGRRLNEQLNFVVFEAGSHTLRDGTQLVAGHQETNDASWSDVDFETTFDSTPVVFTQTENSMRNAFTARLKDIDDGGFSILTQGRERYNPTGRTYDTHWIAIEPGTGTNADGVFEVGSTGESVTDELSTIDFSAGFGSTPGLLAATQTSNELDTVAIRINDVNDQSARVFLEEETSLDSELAHAAETVGYLAFLANQRFFAMEDSSSDDGFAFDSRGQANDGSKEIPGNVENQASEIDPLFASRPDDNLQPEKNLTTRQVDPDSVKRSGDLQPLALVAENSKLVVDDSIPMEFESKSEQSQKPFRLVDGVFAEFKSNVNRR